MVIKSGLIIRSRNVLIRQHRVSIWAPWIRDVVGHRFVPIVEVLRRIGVTGDIATVHRVDIMAEVMIMTIMIAIRHRIVTVTGVAHLRGIMMIDVGGAPDPTIVTGTIIDNYISLHLPSFPVLFLRASKKNYQLFLVKQLHSLFFSFFP